MRCFDGAQIGNSLKYETPSTNDENFKAPVRNRENYEH